MKTVEEYINEKQNFVFGGKAGLTGKEYGEAKTFGSLKKGDIFYSYEIDDRKVVGPRKLVFDKYQRIDTGQLIIRVELFSGPRGLTTGTKAPDVLNGEDCSVFVTNYPNKLGVNLYSIEELKDSEVWNIAQKMRKNELRDKDVAIYEDANFVFGGKAGLTGKEYGVARTKFSELTKGDTLYYWMFIRGEIKTHQEMTIKKVNSISEQLLFEVTFTDENGIKKTDTYAIDNCDADKDTSIWEFNGGPCICMLSTIDYSDNAAIVTMDELALSNTKKL